MTHRPPRAAVCCPLAALAAVLAAAAVSVPARAGRFVASDAAKPPAERLSRGMDFARRDGRRQVVLLRQQDCAWCDRLKATLTEHEAIAQELTRFFVVTTVDVSRAEGAEVARRLGADLGLGLPILIVLDGGGRSVAHQETGSFERGAGYDPAKLLAFLRRWEPPRQDAATVYREALARAATAGKRLVVVLGSPFCLGCYALADVLQTPQVAALLGKDFEVVKVDVDRMKGGLEVARRLGFPAEGGVPWLAVVDASGQVVASTGASIESYVPPFRVVERGARRLTAEELGTLARNMGAWGGSAEPR